MKISIIGAGAMGAGIAYVAARSGFDVILNDREKSFLENGMDKIRKMLMDGIDKKKLSPSEAEKIVQRLTLEVDLKLAVKDADLVIEAIFEDMAIKKELFSKLSEYTLENCILATNTSTLSINEIAEEIKRPERVVGMHFFNPPAAMQLVEVIYGPATSQSTIAEIIKITEKLGKVPVKSKDSPGFIVNRVLVPVLNEAIKLLDEGVASKDDIDKAMTLGANFPVGPLTLADFVGLDVALASMKTLESKFGDAYKPSSYLVELVKQNKLGLKSGEGFYKYR